MGCAPSRTSLADVGTDDFRIKQSDVARLTIMKSSVSVCSGGSQCLQACVEGKAAKRTENM